MEDSSNNKINIEDQDEEDGEEIAATYCPYKKVTNFFCGIFNNPSNAKNASKLDGTEKPKCPFGFTSSKKKNEPKEEKPKCPFGFSSTKKEPEQEKPKCPFGFSSNTPKGKCPFGFDNKENKNKIITEEEKNGSDDDSGEDEHFGGCPVMGKGKKIHKIKTLNNIMKYPVLGIMISSFS